MKFSVSYAVIPKDHMSLGKKVTLKFSVSYAVTPKDHMSLGKKVNITLTFSVSIRCQVSRMKLIYFIGSSVNVSRH